MDRRKTHYGVAACMIAAGMLLSSCGGSATTQDTTPTTVAPLPLPSKTADPSDPKSSSSSSSSGATTTSTSDSDVPAAARVKTPADRTMSDQGAKEVSSIPSTTVARTEQDTVFLEHIEGAGVNIKGIEDQLIGTAIEVCRTRAAREQDVTLPAVAGQIVEQQRTTLNPDQTAAAIASAASAAYCRTP